MNELQRLLAVVAEYQNIRMGRRIDTRYALSVQKALDAVDLAALRTQLQQHAESVRDAATWVPLGRSRNVRAAADFLDPEDQ